MSKDLSIHETILLRTSGVDFRASRPRDGFCYLDFLELWLVQAMQAGDATRAYNWSRELAHWARAMDPALKHPDEQL